MKTINLLISIVAIATICLFSCERHTPIQASADNDSMKVNCDTIPTEPDTIESDTIEHKDKRYVPSIYLVNQLDKPIDLEMHHNSFPYFFPPIKKVIHKGRNIPWYHLTFNSSI